MKNEEGPAKPPKATSKLPQSLLIAKGLRPQSHLKATLKPPQSHPKATYMRPTCDPQATPKLPQSQEQARRSGGSFLFSSYSPRVLWWCPPQLHRAAVSL